MKTKLLSLKNMKESLINDSNGDNDMYLDIIDTFDKMYYLGFIGPNTWNKFHEEIRGWMIWKNTVLNIEWSEDGEPIETLIHDYSKGVSYRA